MVSKKEIRERLRHQKEIELDALHPSDRRRVERIGARARKVVIRGETLGKRVENFIDRRAIEGEKIVKKRVKDGVKKLIDGTLPQKVVKRRRGK